MQLSELRVGGCESFDLIINHTTIVCVKAAGIGTYSVRVETDSGYLEYHAIYEAPVISHVHTLETMGGELTIQGYNFGSVITDMNVTINLVSCDIMFMRPQGPIICTYAPGLGQNLPLVLSFNSGQAAALVSYSSTLILFHLFLLCSINIKI